ncbi:MAG: hypothetical protein C0408_02675 [Odoribacter sp.]|nr:hypothetical protein [Odoribacter sp.]
MKKLIVIILSCLITGIATPQQTTKELRKDLKDKAIKEARKEAKKMEREGWSVAPGSIPLSKILENTWMKQVTVEEDGNVRYIYADGNAVAESKSAGEMQAIELGKLQLAGLIQTNMSSLISANIGNAQLSTQEAASVTEIVQSAKNIIAMELGYVDPSFKLFRNIGKDKIEVQVRLFYDVRQSLVIAKKVVRQELKDKLKMNEDKLEKLMGI